MSRARSDATDASLDETLAFVTRELGRKRRRVLEVGCGGGALALRLAELGHAVTGVDRSRKAVERARRAGFPAILGDFLELESGPFDAVIFTRSLHHIHELARALAHAHALLAPGGLFLAEEFSIESMDAATADWFQDLRSVIAAAGALSAPRKGARRNPLRAWRDEHAHVPPLHEGRAMVAAVRRRFTSVRVERGPYLYRYVAERLAGTARGRALGRTVLEHESRHVADGALVPIGLRITGRRATRRGTRSRP